MALLPQSDASLIQQPIVQADVLPLRLRRNLRHFERLQAEVIGLGKRHHIGNEYGRAAAEPAHRQRSLDDTADAPRELEPLLQRKLRPPRIIPPVSLSVGVAISNSTWPVKVSLSRTTLLSSLTSNHKSTPLSIANPVTNPCW